MTTTTKLTAVQVKQFDSLLKDGASVAKLKGYLLMEEIAETEANAYLKERGLKGKKTFRNWLTSKCAEGFVGVEEFTTEITKQSANVQKHKTVYNNERKAYNNIHAKYDDKIKALVEGESKAK